jgi:hypothetical protein
VHWLGCVGMVMTVVVLGWPLCVLQLSTCGGAGAGCMACVSKGCVDGVYQAPTRTPAEAHHGVCAWPCSHPGWHRGVSGAWRCLISSRAVHCCRPRARQAGETAPGT